MATPPIEYLNSHNVIRAWSRLIAEEYMEYESFFAKFLPVEYYHKVFRRRWLQRLWRRTMCRYNYHLWECYPLEMRLKCVACGRQVITKPRSTDTIKFGLRPRFYK